jgi:hypothetical protein
MAAQTRSIKTALGARMALAAACAVLFAAVGVFVVENQPIDVAGTVIDARTSRPIAGAHLNAAGVDATTDAEGGFSALDIKRGTNLRVSADNYRPVDVEATGSPIRVKLRPIPVTGRVTSSFTGTGIGATVRGKESTKTRADGMFITYGLGPGDTLTITAFGHQPKKVKITPKRTATAALALGPMNPNALLRPVKGYRYMDAPIDVAGAMRAEVAAVDPAANAAISGVAARSVVHDGDPFAVAVAVALDPRYASLPGVADAFFDGFAAGAASQETVTIGGYRIRVARGDGLTGYAYQRFAGFVVVLGAPDEEIDAFVRKLIIGDSVSA